MALSVCQAVRLSVAASVRSVVHISCGQDIARGRSLFIFKVKGQIPRSLGLYKELWYLDPCGQDIASTMWPRMIKVSMYTSFGNVQGQRSNFKVTEPLYKNSGTWIRVGRI